jgi:ribosomal protein S12 methylthiotransferase
MMSNKSFSPKNRKVGVMTLGCSKNVVDSEYLLGMLAKNKIETTFDLNKANTVLINTCGFIKPAKDESYDVISQVRELKSDGKINDIIITGCLAGRYLDELKHEMPDVDLICGVAAYKEIMEFLKPGSPYLEHIQRTLLTPSHYAYLKISEGCNHSCSFCAIPFIKGDFVSKPFDEIIAEAQYLIAGGVKELNIIAQDTTYFGVDIDGRRRLAELLDKLAIINPKGWLRLLYTFPMGFPTEVLDVMAQHKNICNYIDIPLQHISDNVLKSMRRGITKKQTIEIVDTIRTKLPYSAIRSTFIVGYPTETEEDFKELYQFIKDTELERVGVFCYSHEENTPAFESGDLIEEKVKEERRDIMMRLQSEISMKKNKELIGKSKLVLIDDVTDDGYIGRTEFDAPDVDNSVIIKTNKQHQPGDYVVAQIIEADYYDLIAKV